jgi:hypothetical protein
MAALLSSLIRSFIFEGETSSLSHVLDELLFLAFATLMNWITRRKEAFEVAIADRTAKQRMRTYTGGKSSSMSCSSSRPTR